MVKTRYFIHCNEIAPITIVGVHLLGQSMMISSGMNPTIVSRVTNLMECLPNVGY